LGGALNENSVPKEMQYPQNKSSPGPLPAMTREEREKEGRSSSFIPENNFVLDKIWV